MEAKGKKVVVVGGGVAGALLAKTLQLEADVVLIDPKEYFEIPWARLRPMVEPSFGEKIMIKHTEYLTKARIITSTATSITETEVMTEDGEAVAYDYLVIATGHADSVPRYTKDRLEEFQQDNKKIKEANSVLIIGGGPTGVELAGEIINDYPDKKITMVHKGSRLLEFIGPKASNKATKWLKSKGVEVLLQETVDLDSTSGEDNVFKTSSGKSITADCYFVCVGRPLASSWLQGTILKDNLDKLGRLVVDENLRVKGQKNIFAIGDITDIPELKQGYLAQEHAKLVAKNVKLLIKGAPESKLGAYKPASAMAIVTLGRKIAVAQFPFMTAFGRFPGMIKSKDLFVSRTRSVMLGK